MSNPITDFECPICFEEFNHVSKRPKTITPCMHTVCERCLPNIYHCPKCRKVITDSAFAYSLLGAIEQFALERRELQELRAAAEKQKEESESNIEKLQLAVQQRIDLVVNQEKTHQEAEIEKLKLEIDQLKLAKEQRRAQGRLTSRYGYPIKNALLIRGLPKNVSNVDIFKWFFHSNPIIRDGSEGIAMKEAGNKQNCIVFFENHIESLKVIKEWNRKVYPGTASTLIVDYLRRGGRENERLNARTQKVDKRMVFICGLPTNIGAKELKTWIFKDNEKLIEKSIKLTASGLDQLCHAQFIDENEAKKLIDEWNGKEYPGTSRLLKVDYYTPHGKNELARARNGKNRKISGRVISVRTPG